MHEKAWNGYILNGLDHSIEVFKPNMWTKDEHDSGNIRAYFDSLPFSQSAFHPIYRF